MSKSTSIECNFLPTLAFDDEHDHSDFGKQDQALPNLTSYRSYLPALNPIWKGGFIVVDSSSFVDFLGGFQAKPPCRVHRKAYEFARKMPPVLGAELLPRFHLWDEMFQSNWTDLRDIALYFSPINERSKSNYSWLFEWMEIQNSVMRSYINDVELLIFTSKQLNLHSQNFMAMSNDEHFLCGIFRSANKTKVLYKEDNEIEKEELGR